MEGRAWWRDFGSASALLGEPTAGNAHDRVACLANPAMRAELPFSPERAARAGRVCPSVESSLPRRRHHPEKIGSPTRKDNGNRSHRSYRWTWST